jgi:hypothetical protein
MSQNDRNQVDWRKSARCDSASCVEVGITDEAVLIRDGKRPEGSILEFSPAEWVAFVEGVRAGEFNL